MASGVQEAEFPSEIKQVLMMEKAGESSRKSQSPLNDRHSWLVLILIIEEGDVEKAMQSHRNKCRHSWLVPMLMVANLAMFCSAMYMNNCPQHFPLCERKCVGSFLGRFSFEPLSHNPLFGPSSTTLKKMGAIEWEKVVIQNQEWRLIWLHAGIIHLFVDMLSLFFIGIRLEQHFGFVRVGSIYLLSGLAGSVVSTVFVGASGALFGLLGADLAQIVTNWQLCTNKAAALCTLLIYIAINLAIGILPHVDNFCNIGGFIAGLLLGFLLLPLPPDGWFDFPDYVGGARVAFKYKYQLHQYVLCLVSVVLLVLGFTLALVMLFRGVNGSDGCHWCHYLECAPTSIWNCSESDSSNNCGWMLRLIIEWLLESRAELGPNFDQISFESGFIEILRALTKSTLVPELHFCIQKYLNLK